MNSINKYRTTKGLILVVSTISFCIFSYCRTMAIENNVVDLTNQLNKISNISYKKNSSVSKVIDKNEISYKKEDSQSITNKYNISMESKGVGKGELNIKTKVKPKLVVTNVKQSTVSVAKKSNSNKNNVVLDSNKKNDNVSNSNIDVISNKTIAANNEQVALLTLPANGRISSFFGYRKVTLNDGTVESGIHKGLDIAVPMGTKIGAAMSGEVEFAGVQEGYGNVIILKHSNGLETLYGHCSRIEVNKGEKVNTGDEIGKAGSTGRSTGPHIHFEVRLNGNAVDPLKYLSSKIVKN